MVTSNFRPEMEIWPFQFRACAMHPAIIIGTVRSLWTWLWGRYHFPQNVFVGVDNFVGNLSINRQKAKTNMMLVPMLLPTLLLLQVIIPVTPRLLSVHVTSYKRLRNAKNGLDLCALDTANKTMSSSSVEDCSLSCTRVNTCIGFNIKNSLTCDHVMTPVLASTSRTLSPVIT